MVFCVNSSALRIMLVSGIVVLVGLCGFAVNAGDPTIEINIEKVSIDNVDNPLTDPWSATVDSAKPVNKLTLKIPVKADIPAETKMKLKVKIGGSPLPDVDTTACEAFNDEVIGKGVVAAGNPFPDKCPVKKGEYMVVNYFPEKERMPPGLPDGKFEATIEFNMPDGKPVAIVHFEGTIAHKAPGMG